MNETTVSPLDFKAINERLNGIEKLLRKAPVTNSSILTTEDLMEYLSVCRRTIFTWRTEGKIKYSALNNKFYYYVSDVHQMLNQHVVKIED